jgi:hypothetical protein
MVLFTFVLKESRDGSKKKEGGRREKEERSRGKETTGKIVLIMC